MGLESFSKVGNNESNCAHPTADGYWLLSCAQDQNQPEVLSNMPIEVVSAQVATRPSSVTGEEHRAILDQGNIEFRRLSGNPAATPPIFGLDSINRNDTEARGHYQRVWRAELQTRYLADRATWEAAYRTRNGNQNPDAADLTRFNQQWGNTYQRNFPRNLLQTIGADSLLPATGANSLMSQAELVAENTRWRARFTNFYNQPSPLAGTPQERMQRRQTRSGTWTPQAFYDEDLREWRTSFQARTGMAPNQAETTRYQERWNRLFTGELDGR